MSNNKKDKYITLKEAAEISGYAPDYIGQLIRGGKLEGKQVFSNVAWVTTEKAIREYADKSRNRRSKVNADTPASFSFSEFGKNHYQRLYKTLLYALIGIGVLFALFLFYILSVSLDDYLDERAARRALEWTSTNQIQVPNPDVPQLPL